MSINSFLKLVEIQTKIASVFPFLIGCLFVYFRYDTFQPMNTLIFFFSMLLIDLTTTAINNYMDFKTAKDRDYRKKRNIIGQQNIPEWVVITTIFTLFFTATGLGVWLVFRTDLLVLLIGVVCFSIGILYTFGPIPFSRMPLGEVFSGATMGFGIIFLIVYVNAFDQGIAQLVWQGRTISFEADIIKIIEIIIVSLPCVFTIANLMLANNICDLEDDIVNRRYTLPYYLGKKYSIWLFDLLYLATFGAIIVAVLFRLLPTIMLFTLVIAIPVYKHVRLFNRKQEKSETFFVAVKNLILVNSSIVAFLLISFLL
ncbi:1,4-dihydroxy-2-naphthoate polyprenyltransferase [Bacillaceae bacterium S4-13-56]